MGLIKQIPRYRSLLARAGAILCNTALDDTCPVSGPRGQTNKSKEWEREDFFPRTILMPHYEEREHCCVLLWDITQGRFNLSCIVVGY